MDQCNIFANVTKAIVVKSIKYTTWHMSKGGRSIFVFQNDTQCKCNNILYYYIQLANLFAI